MVSRVYVEKKPGFDVEAQQLAHELRDILGIERLEGLRLVNRYDVEGIDGRALRPAACPSVFSEPQVRRGDCYEMPAADGAAVFAVEYLPGAVRPACRLGQPSASSSSHSGERPERAQRDRVYLLAGAAARGGRRGRRSSIT